MRRIYILIVCVLGIMTVTKHNAQAKNIFPEFEVSQQRVYIPIEKIVIGYQEDLENEVGFNFSYNVLGQFFTVPGDGHIQSLSEGFSGISAKSTPWETLTELLAAYHKETAEGVKSLYAQDSQAYIAQRLSDADVSQRFVNYMNTVKGMRVLLGFYHKNGFVAFVELDYGEHAEFRYRLTPFFFVKSDSKYLLSNTTLDEPITANISLYLQNLEHDVPQLLAPRHGLTVEKSGTGSGVIKGSGIDCGNDCIEVYVEGTAVWLKANADEYSTFEGWLVDGEPLSERLVIKEDTTVTAVFEKFPPKEYTVSIEMAGTGTGTVVDSDAACEAEDASCLELFSFYAGAEDAPLEIVELDCGDTCSATYTEGTTVYLRATATEGSEFVEWQMNGETVTAPVEISDDTTLTAVFDVVAPPEEGETPDPEDGSFSEP